MILRHRAISRVFGTCCAVALAVSACGSPSNTASVAQTDSTSTADSATPTSTSTSEDRYVSPLDAFLGMGNGKEPTEAETAAREQQQREIEQQIKTCMQAQGFEYVAVDPSAGGGGGKAGIKALSAAEFAAQYGYGITTFEFDASPSDNPNDAIVQAMTVPQRAAYFQALYGGMIAVDANGFPTKRQKGEDAQATDTSCAEQAKIAVFGPPPTHDSSSADSYTAIEDSISALYDRIDTDPRLSAPRAAWLECMAVAGYPGYTALRDGYDEVNRRANEVIGDRNPREVDPTALSELRAFEIAVATADYQCTRAYDVVHETVQTELEQAFIEENRAELEQYRDAIAAGKAGKG